MAITVFSFGIKSSMDKSYSSKPIDVLLSSPYFSAINKISCLITRSRRFLSPKIALSSRILFTSSSYSPCRRARSSPVNARRRMSTIAWAWTSVSPNAVINPSLASCVFLLARIIRITSSIFSSAFKSPSKMWALSCALFKSYLVLLVTTSSWCCK